MNVRELREKIKDLPDDMLVYVSHCDYGPQEAAKAEVYPDPDAHFNKEKSKPVLFITE